MWEHRNSRGGNAKPWRKNGCKIAMHNSLDFRQIILPQTFKMCCLQKHILITYIARDVI